MSIDNFLGLLDEDVTKPVSQQRKLGYVQETGKITLSFSRMSTLRSCPRKFLLRELNQRAPSEGTVDTAYGSAFGAAVQAMFKYNSLERAWLAALSEWDYEGFESPFTNKRPKSFWSCLATIEAFWNSEYQVISAQYKLAEFEGKEGIELFVYMSAGESYSYQVHIDLILQNRETDAILVAEIKTAGMAQQEANWGNANQTLGYYAIMQFLCDKYDVPFEPQVMYITSHAGKYLEGMENFGFNTFVFDKPPELALDFARDVVLTTETIEMYIEHNYFPKNGSSCVTYNRPCEFYGLCDLESMQDFNEAEHGTTYESLTMDDVDFSFDLSELIGKL